MRPRTLLILLLLVVGLAAFAWFVDRELPGSEERNEKAKQVLRFDAEQVVAVRIERGEQRLRLQRDRPSVAADESPKGEEGGKDRPAAAPVWRLVEPLNALADDAKVRSLLSDLGSLESQRAIEQPDRSALGLASPRARVILERQKDAEVELAEVVLEIGAAVPSSDSMIVAQSGESTAHVVADRLFEALDRDAAQWRDHKLFRGERAAVETIRLTAAGGPEVTLVKRGDEMWLESPVIDRAEGDQVERLLKDLVALRAEKFLDRAGDSSASELGLDPPRATIEALAGDGSRILDLALGSEVGASGGGSGGRYARAGEEWVELADGLEQWWAKPVEEWRSMDWTSLESWQIDDATIDRPSGRLVLRREGVDWHRDGVAIPFTSVNDFFAALSETQALDLVAETALATPVMTLTLASSEGEEEILTLYPPTSRETGAAMPATVSGRDVVLLLPATTLEELESKIEAIQAAEPLPQAEIDEDDDLTIEAEEGA